MHFDTPHAHHGHDDHHHAGHPRMGRGRRLFAKGLLRGMGRRGPFGRHGDPRGFFEDGEGERHHFGGRGRGRGGRMFAPGELRLLLLGLIARESRHGYDLIKAIETLTGGAYAPSPGVVYPTLALLVDEGLIAEAPGTAARRAFEATAAGSAEAEAQADTVAAIIARLEAQGADAAREASPSIMRAMANLRHALKNRVLKAVFDESVAHAIADVLDETARKIERL